HGGHPGELTSPARPKTLFIGRSATMREIMNFGIRLRFACLVGCALLASACSSANPYAGPVPRTIEAFVPPGAEVHGEYFKEFEVDGDVVRLTLVEYGLLRDCPSGCFS